MTPEAITGLNHLAASNRPAAQRSVAEMCDADLRDAILVLKPGASLWDLVLTEVRVRALTHRDQAVALIQVEVTRDVDLLRAAWRRESEGERRVQVLAAITARGRVVVNGERGTGKAERGTGNAEHGTGKDPVAAVTTNLGDVRP